MGIFRNDKDHKKIRKQWLKAQENAKRNKRKNSKKSKKDYEDVKNQWINAQEKVKSKQSKSSRSSDASYENVRNQWFKIQEEAKLEQIKKYTNNNRNKESYEDLQSKWNEYRNNDLIRRLNEIEDNRDINKPIKLSRNNRYQQYHAMRIQSIIISFIFYYINGSFLLIYIIILTELLFAPIRQIIDSNFDLYARIEGICTDINYPSYAINQPRRDKDYGIEVTLTYGRGKKTKKFIAVGTVDIPKGHKMSIIQGKLSRKIVYIESHCINVKR